MENPKAVRMFIKRARSAPADSARPIALPVAFGGMKAPNYCPFCGVDQDQPIPKSTEPSESDAVTTTGMVRTQAASNDQNNVTTPDKLVWK